MFKLIFFILALSVYAQVPEISLNNMEPPQTELFYSNETDTLYLKVVIPQGWHINADKVPDDFLVASKIEASAPGLEFEASYMAGTDKAIQRPAEYGIAFAARYLHR